MISLEGNIMMSLTPLSEGNTIKMINYIQSLMEHRKADCSCREKLETPFTCSVPNLSNLFYSSLT